MLILTAQQACDALNFSSPEEMPEKVTTIFLPAIDSFIQNATGKNWGDLTETYTAIDPVAIMAASVLLVQWIEDPGMIGKTGDPGVLGMIGQLKARVIQENQSS